MLVLNEKRVNKEILYHYLKFLSNFYRVYLHHSLFYFCKYFCFFRRRHYVNEDACKNILKNGNSKELEKEQFWQGIFQILDKDSEQQATKTESTTDSKVVVKADGSRVLMITINVNGIKMTMSLEISKPSDTTTLNASDLQSVNSEL